MALSPYGRKLYTALAIIPLLVGCTNESEPPPPQVVTIQVLHTPEVRSYLSAMRDAFATSLPTLQEGSRVQVELLPELGVPAAHKIASGEIKADAWLAPSSALISLTNSRVQNLGAHQVDCQQLFGTPVVLAVPSAQQSLVDAGGQTFDWHHLFSQIAASHVDGAHSLRFSHAPPKASVSGLAVTTQLLAFALDGPTAPVSKLEWSEHAMQVLREYEQHVSEYSLSEGFLLERSAQSPPELAHITLTTEQQVALFNQNAGRPTPPVTALYPQRATVWQDYTLCRSDADWVSQSRREATQLFQRFMTSEGAQASLPRHGFRPSISKQADRNMLGPRVGVNLALPSDSLPAAHGSVLTEILSHWERLLRPVSITIVIDTSASMEGDTLTAVKDALRDFLARVPPHITMSLVAFASEPRLVVPFTSDRAQPIAALDTLTAQGGSAAYDAIKFGMDNFTPRERAIYRQILLVITDGEGQTSTMTQGSLQSAFTKAIRERDLLPIIVTIRREGAAYPDLAEIARRADGRYKEVSIGEIAPQFEDILKSL